MALTKTHGGSTGRAVGRSTGKAVGWSTGRAAGRSMGRGKIPSALENLKTEEACQASARHAKQTVPADRMDERDGSGVSTRNQL